MAISTPSSSPRRVLTDFALTDRITEILDLIQVLPAAGQGALGVECRADDDALVAALGALDDADTRAAVTAERAVLATLEAGCTARRGPADVVDEGDRLGLFLRAFVGIGRRRRRTTPPLAHRPGGRPGTGWPRTRRATPRRTRPRHRPGDLTPAGRRAPSAGDGIRLHRPRPTPESGAQ